MSEAPPSQTQLLDGFRQLYDLSGNDRTTREVGVLGVDEDGVPSSLIEGRQSPYTVLPVEHGDEPTVFAGSLCVEPGSAVDAPGGLDRPTGERGHSSLITSTERIAEAGPGAMPGASAGEGSGTVPRETETGAGSASRGPAGGGGAGASFPADLAPVSPLIHVVAGRACLVGNDARERHPAEAAKGLAPAGGYLAWARTLPGAVADIVTRLGDAAGPMKRGFGTPFQETGAANLDRSFPSEVVSGQPGAGKNAFVAGASFAPGPTAQDLPNVRFARDPAGNIKAYDEAGRPIDGIFVYRDRHGTTRWFDPSTGRRGFVRQVINVGLPGYNGTGSLYDGFLNPDGTISLGTRQPVAAGVEAVRDETFATARLDRPVLIRDADGIPRTVVAVERNGFGRYTLITIDGSRFPGSFADIREAENGDVFIRDPASGRGVFLGNTRPGTVTLGFSGGIEYNVLPGGELGIPVGLPQGNRVLRAGITGIQYAVGSPQYRSVVASAQREAGRIIASATGQAPPSSVISELGPQRFIPGNLSPDEQERLQLSLDIVEDGRRGLLLGSTTAARKEQEATDLARGLADAIARRPHETGLLLETLFGPYNGVAYPLAFNAPLSQSARNLTSVGRRWGAGYLLELGGKWRPVCPIDETIPPAPPPPGGPGDGGGGGGVEEEDGEDTPPPERKHDAPPPAEGEDDLENVGGQLVPRGLPWERPRDGELAACDETPLPEDPRTPVPGEGLPTGTPGVTGPNVDPEPLGTLGGSELAGIVSNGPGTRGARIDALAGRTALQPRLPRMNPAGDQRQRLGGGPYLRGAPLVPRGGIRLIDRFDFHRGHTVWDALNLAFDTINRLTSLVNERFPFAPDAIQGAGLKLPGQPLERVRVEQFDPGTLINVAVVTERGTRTVAPHVVLRDRRGVKRLRQIAGDHLAERVIGLGDVAEDVLLRFDHGRSRRSDRKDLPAFGWDHATKSLVFRNAPVDFETDVHLLGNARVEGHVELKDLGDAPVGDRRLRTVDGLVRVTDASDVEGPNLSSSSLGNGAVAHGVSIDLGRQRTGTEPGVEGVTIQLRRGSKALLPANLFAGEVYVASDTGEVFIGRAQEPEEPPAGDYDSVVLATPGVVHYWPLDEAAGPTAGEDKSGVTGSYSELVVFADIDAPFPSHPGRKAPRFTDTMGPHVSAGGTVVLGGAGSTEFWIKTTQGGEVLLFNDEGTFEVQVTGPGVTVNTDGDPELTGGNVMDGAWHQVVVTWNNAVPERKLYIDGALVASSAVCGFAGISTNTWRMGAANVGDSYRGHVCAVSLYSTALDPATVAAHYDAR